MRPRTCQRHTAIETDAVALARGLDRRQRCSLFLDGGGGFAEAWTVSPLLAIDPTVLFSVRPRAPNEASAALERLDRIVAGRRAVGGVEETGVAVLAGYEMSGRADRPADATRTLPQLVALGVDRSVRLTDPRSAVVSVRHPSGSAPTVEHVIESLTAAASPVAGRPVRSAGRPRTSLPRERYLRAVGRVKEHIGRGDVYQANLCQRFEVPYHGDPYEAYAAMSAEVGAPHSAFVRSPEVAVASLSPETFLRGNRSGAIETRPIKGTRPRGATPAADRAAARELCSSEKDRAELLMIVDLERNDLSRVCEVGTVRVSELRGLRSYATVHHLVAVIHGRLRPDIGVADLLRATFPGGSITGAPKIRAMEILRELEPVPRAFFTGCLFWFADDGKLDSSILIRTVLFDGRHALVGAGGGIVADSDPEQEWLESNHKARALTERLGFDPEEAV